MKSAPSPRGNNPTRIETVPEPAAVPAPRGSLDASELLGCQVGNYVIERPLAQGGMARVFVARHPHLGREVAVKFLNPELQGDVDLDQRFLNEARVMAGLRHPNIVDIYDFGKLEHLSYYTMELLRGTDLGTLMEAKKRFTPAEALEYLTQICAALEAAHHVGVVHRDLKPANVFVLEEQSLHVKLMDFGIAKLQHQKFGRGTLHGQILGTPTHMAPEQAMGLGDRISPQTDLYSFGVIAYEMLVGQLPFVASSEVLLMAMHVRDPVPPIRSRQPDVPKRLAELVEQCLAKNPEERPESARRLSERLREALRPKRSAKDWAAAPYARRSSARNKAVVAPRESDLGQPPAPRADSGVAPSRLEPPRAAPSSDAESPKSAKKLLNAPYAEPSRTIIEPVRPVPIGAPEVEGDAPLGPPPLLSELTCDPSELGRSIVLTPGDGKALDRLFKRMQRRADFPAFLNNVTEISIKSDADSPYSPNQLAEAILKDFALTAKLLRMANTLFASRFGGKVFSVRQAVVILGFDHVRSIALGVSVFKMPGQRSGSQGAPKVARGDFHDQLADASINSLVAGEIARMLAHRAGVRDGELAMTCAMFKNLGQQLLMEYLPEEHGQIERLVAQGVPLTYAQTRVLGTSTTKLGLGVAERWNLPPRLQLALAANPTPTDRLERDEQRLAALGKFANDLCYIVTTGQRRDWQKSVERLLARNQNLLNLQPKEITGLLGLVCKSFEERYAALLGPFAKRSRFLRNARTLNGEDGEARPSLQPLSRDELDRLARTTEQLTAAVRNREDPKLMLSTALSALAAALSSPRVLFLVMTSDRQNLVVGAALGEDALALSKHFRIPITHKPDVFWAAQRSGKGTIIRDALSSNSMRRVPQQYYEALGSPAFGVYPCVSPGYQTALVVCDAPFADRLPTSDRVAATAPLRELMAKIAERLSSI